MRLIYLMPILLGIIAAYGINYLADVLPSTLRLSRPVCLNPACGRSFEWVNYLLFRRCAYCAYSRGKRPFVVLIFCILSALYLWYAHPLKISFILSFILLVYLYLVAIIDLERHLVLRSLSITGLCLTALAGFLLHGWIATLFGGLAGFVIMFLTYLFGKLLNRLRTRYLAISLEETGEVLATGDITLATILGLLMGWPLVLYGLILAVLVSGFIAAVLFLAMVLTQQYRQHAFKVFLPLGSFFILSSILLVYFPGWIAKVLPNLIQLG